MAAHLIVLGKLRLLNGVHSNWKLLAALLCPFALKLPFAMHMPASYSDMGLSVRLFLFRLNQIFFDGGGRSHQRWERALRLLHERLLGPRPNEDDLMALSMIAL